MFNEIAKLGLELVFEMVAAPANKTFFYRNELKRIIQPRILNDYRLHNIAGPLLYAVTDNSGTLRYVGKWVTSTPLYARWFRHDHIHHQKSSRTHYLAELDQGRAPLKVWSISTRELRPKLPNSELTDYALTEALEGLWISRWRSQLWNKQCPSYPSDFTDGEYWKNDL